MLRKNELPVLFIVSCLVPIHLSSGNDFLAIIILYLIFGELLKELIIEGMKPDRKGRRFEVWTCIYDIFGISLIYEMWQQEMAFILIALLVIFVVVNTVTIIRAIIHNNHS